jgi:hypothetical protein
VIVVSPRTAPFRGVRRFLRSAVPILSALPAIGAAGPAVGVPPLVVTQVPLEADGDLPPGTRIVSYDPARPEREPVNLTPGFAAAGAPNVSFDGLHVLFVGQRVAGDALDVWEMDVDGGNPRRITDDVGDCQEAVYLSAIYTIDDLEPTYQIAFCAGDPPALFTCRMDGTRVSQITFNPLGATDPYPLRDGRLLFSAARSAGGSALFTVNTDGTDVFVFAAAHEPPAARGMACETRDEVIYVETAGEESSGGRLVAVSQTASLHSRRVIAGEDGELYRSPVVTVEGKLVVSYRAGAGSYGLYLLDPSTGRRERVYDAPEWHEIGAAVLRARPEPAGRSSVVDEQTETGLLYCLDAYQSDLVPDGERVPIEWVEIFGTSSEGERRLATADVESDGSFYLQVPARTPLRLRTLDPEGRVLQSMDSWLWVMPRESRGCIGCHEDRELTPPNRHALALRKPPQRVRPAEVDVP